MKYCLAFVVWNLSFGIIGLGIFAWEFSLGCYACEVSLGKFRLRSFALKHSLGNFGFGCFVWELPLEIFRLIYFASDFSLRNFRFDPFLSMATTALETEARSHGRTLMQIAADGPDYINAVQHCQWLASVAFAKLGKGGPRYINRPCSSVCGW